MPRSKVNMMVDFSGIVDAIGTIEGVGDAMESPEYIDGLLTAAHNVASLEFDVDAAATAAAGTMTHVYEFGTRGITRGTPRFSDPTSALSRLWVHTESGEGNIKNLGFVFREAVAPNPRPSAEFYGVSSSVIKKLSRRKYVFRNKAAVNEYGITVNIKPKEKPFNFVPFYGKPPHNPKYKRGYIFRPIEGNQPMRSTPGDAENNGKPARGTFTAFWNTWWAGQGQELVTGDMNKHYNEDVAFLLNRYPSSQGGLQSVVKYNSRGRIYNRRRKIKARMVKLGALRGTNRRR